MSELNTRAAQVRIAELEQQLAVAENYQRNFEHATKLEREDAERERDKLEAVAQAARDCVKWISEEAWQESAVLRRALEDAGL